MQRLIFREESHDAVLRVISCFTDFRSPRTCNAELTEVVVLAQESFWHCYCRQDQQRRKKHDVRQSQSFKKWSCQTGEGLYSGKTFAVHATNQTFSHFPSPHWLIPKIWEVKQISKGSHSAISSFSEVSTSKKKSKLSVILTELDS